MTMHAWQSSNSETMGTCRVLKKALACLLVGDMTCVNFMWHTTRLQRKKVTLSAFQGAYEG